MNLNEIRESIINDSFNKEYKEKGLKPIYDVSENSKILIIGQAPGIKAQESGITWNDKSGDSLRDWLGITRKEFYDPNLFGLVPMDFFYPGKSKSGDKPPRKGFAEKWHPLILNNLKDVKLIILVGSYAQKYYLKEHFKENLTNTVKNYFEYLPKYFPIVHSSPLNFRWQNNNPWFLTDVVPKLKELVRTIID